MSIFWKGFALQFANFLERLRAAVRQCEDLPFWNHGIDRVYHGL